MKEKSRRGKQAPGQGMEKGTSFRVRRDDKLHVVGPDGSDIDPANRYLERLRVRGMSPFTIDAYAYDLVTIDRWLQHENLDLATLSEDDVYRFIAWERGRGCHAKSINRRLHTLRGYYAHVTGEPLPGGDERRSVGNHRVHDHELGLFRIRTPPTRRLRVKEPKRIVEPLRVEQVKLLLRSFKRYRDLCIAHLMLLCGLRTQEVLNLHLDSIDFDDRRLRVRGKGDKERTLPLPPLLISMLQQYLALERPHDCPTSRFFVVLQGRRRGQPMTRAGLRRLFRWRRKQSVLANANPHRLRHTFGTDMARSNVRLPVLQRMMGHAHIETTIQYITLSMTDVAAEFHRACEAIAPRYRQERSSE